MKAVRKRVFLRQSLSTGDMTLLSKSMMATIQDISNASSSNDNLCSSAAHLYRATEGHVNYAPAVNTGRDTTNVASTCLVYVVKCFCQLKCITKLYNHISY